MFVSFFQGWLIVIITCACMIDGSKKMQTLVRVLGSCVIDRYSNRDCIWQAVMDARDFPVSTIYLLWGHLSNFSFSILVPEISAFPLYHCLLSTLHISFILACDFITFHFNNIFRKKKLHKMTARQQTDKTGK